MADMFGFQNVDVSMELDSLECGLEFDEVNILDGLPSPPHSDSLHFGTLASLLPPHEQEQEQAAGGAEVESSFTHSATPLPANNNNNNPDVELAAEAVAGGWESQFKGSSGAAASDTLAAITASHLPLPLVPTADVPAPPPPQPTLPPALEEWFARGISTSRDGPRNQPDLLSSQHGHMHMPQGMGVGKEQEPNNQVTLGKNMATQNASPGINQQQHPSQPSSIIQRNTPESGVGITGTGTLNQGQLLSNRQAQAPTKWSSRWSRYLKSPPRNAHDYRSAPTSLPYDIPAIPRPQQFLPLTAQGSHVPTTQNMLDSQNSLQPPCPKYSRPESSSNYQSPTTPVPPNTYEHQPAVPRLMLPEPAVSVRPTILSPNYHPQPGSSVIASFINSFGTGPYLPQRYPDIRDYQRNFLHSQNLMPHGGFAHQPLGLTPPLSAASPPVSDNSNEHSQPWNRPIVQGSSPLHGPPILPKVSVPNMQRTVIVEPSQPVKIAPDASNPSSSSLLAFKTPELPTLPWIPNSSVNQLQNVAPASADVFTANANSGNFVTPSSSTRPPITNRVRRILNLGTTPPPPKSPNPKAASSSGKKAATSNKSASQTNAQQIQIPEFQDPVERWIKELETELNRAWNQPQPCKKKAAARSARGSVGRREKGESSAPKRRKSNPAEKEKEDARSVPVEAAKTYEYEVNVSHDPNASEFHEQREVDNSAYDTHYQNLGVPMDPHIRFYRTAARRNRG